MTTPPAAWILAADKWLDEHENDPHPPGFDKREVVHGTFAGVTWAMTNEEVRRRAAALRADPL